MNQEQEIILDNKRYFKFYLIAPMIATAVYSLSVFIMGLILMIAVAPECALIWFGLILSPAIYFLMKGVLSYYILNIYYLKEIKVNTAYIYKQMNEGETKVKIELNGKKKNEAVIKGRPMLKSGTDLKCPLCKTIVTPDAKFCPNCKTRFI